jgi:aminoglycoside phosphotransferase (APT) family kinase protein
MSRFSAVEALRGAELIRHLPGGPASSSFLLQADGHRLVARIDKPAARTLKLDRQSEIEVLQAVSAAGIGPELVWADAQQGLLVCTYLEGSACSREQIRDPVLLRDLASTLRRLHKLPPAGPEFEPEAALRNYAGKLATPAANRMADRACMLLDQLKEESGPRALCHNDLVHSNIIRHQPIRLIDWEYAAVGDPFFDLAVVVRHHDLNTTLTSGFLQAYFGSLLPEQLEKLELYGVLYDHLSSLWYLSMDDGSGLAPDLDEELQRVMARLKQ